MNPRFVEAVTFQCFVDGHDKVIEYILDNDEAIRLGEAEDEAVRHRSEFIKFTTQDGIAVILTTIDTVTMTYFNAKRLNKFDEPLRDGLARIRVRGCNKPFIFSFLDPSEAARVFNTLESISGIREGELMISWKSETGESIDFMSQSIVSIELPEYYIECIDNRCLEDSTICQSIEIN